MNEINTYDIDEMKGTLYSVDNPDQELVSLPKAHVFLNAAVVETTIISDEFFAADAQGGS